MLLANTFLLCCDQTLSLRSLKPHSGSESVSWRNDKKIEMMITFSLSRAVFKYRILRLCLLSEKPILAAYRFRSFHLGISSVKRLKRSGDCRLVPCHTLDCRLQLLDFFFFHA